jgi:hypothetical protein
MGIPLTSQFDANMQLPLDSRIVVADPTARDAIVSGRRFEGLSVYVVSEAKTYQLQGGITDSDWVQTGGAGGGGVPSQIGETGDPRIIVPADGILEVDENMSTTAVSQVIYAECFDAGVTDISANPQIEAGTVIGQFMELKGTSSTHAYKLKDGNGLDLNAEWVSFNKNTLGLRWNGTVWSECYRRD